MRRILLTLTLLGFMVAPVRAQLVAPEAWGGAFFGAMFGGLAGADCHHDFSGTGAAIGAGVGFVVGAIAGEANRRSGSVDAVPAYAPAVYAQPGYGYVYGYAPPPRAVPVVPPPAAPPKATPKPTQKVTRAAKPSSPLVQIPDAPRVPDAPTF